MTDQAAGTHRSDVKDVRCITAGLIAEEWICSDMATVLGQIS
jgi:hypothetical protein